MAGMEQLVIHSKSYLVRWIQVTSGHSISWSLQPHKKSINFGIFKHPTANHDLTPSLPSVSNFDAGQTALLTGNSDERKSSVGSQKNDNPVVEKLQGIGLKCVAWTGRCQAEKVSMGTYDVTEGEGGMYGLVFDNTFSKQNSKKVTFVLMTYPSKSPPKSGHHLHFSQAFAGSNISSTNSRNSPALHPLPDSSELLPQDLHRGTLSDPRPRSTHGHAKESKSPMGSTFYTGVLLKKRRRKNQGFARRFFSLDFQTCTLSYYQNRHSSALRGSVPLSLAAVGVNEKNREISIDSGAEIWHLKASNKRDFSGWRDALEKAAHSTVSVASPVANMSTPSGLSIPARGNTAEDRDWAQVETLVGRVSGIQDAIRRLARQQDTTRLSPVNTGLGIAAAGGGDTPSPAESASSDYFEDTLKPEKRPFWKRSPSSGGASPSGLFRRSVSAQLAVPMPAGTQSLQQLPNGSIKVPRSRKSDRDLSSGSKLSEHCEVILRDLDAVLADFSALLNENKQRRSAVPPSAVSRLSMESTSTQEFFDAEDGGIMSPSQIFTIRPDSDGASEKGEFDDAPSNPDSEASTDAEDEDSQDEERVGRKSHADGGHTLFPTKAKTLTPLPIASRIPRRTTVPPAKLAPPSLVGFLRKNVGKDLSTISMPVSANEPLSLLQRVGETFEYTHLLDAAASDTSPDGTSRLLHVTAFAISYLSSSRVKDRAIRKPFNPMLGETFELVREDLGFRFLAEKVVHRPVRIACQAESANWTFAQAPMPMQKFWGKSAELNTEGRARIVLHLHGNGGAPECYSFTPPTSFLRNIIAGEKYVEPSGTLTVVCDTSGATATATFKAGGMFSGRSEDVSVSVTGAPDGAPLGLAGKWTGHLNLTRDGVDTGTTVWKTGALVPDAASRYGFTTFAASLNQITALEEGKLPVTDSRLRPDQRAAEGGDLDSAEAMKARLEERQRARRKVMEDHGDEWRPRWFTKVVEGEGGDEVWKLKAGKDGYWEERAKGEWTGVVDVFR
ncbi:MAG: hypothetical protein M1822_000133 [Bathelium mastoideum]|nr:MAG: hypothetical protein M1822_000133 [Bathelium mastoideum]